MQSDFTVFIVMVIMLTLKKNKLLVQTMPTSGLNMKTAINADTGNGMVLHSYSIENNFLWCE